jgi:phosphoribosylanthranilate isomerase
VSGTKYGTLRTGNRALGTEKPRDQGNRGRHPPVRWPMGQDRAMLVQIYGLTDVDDAREVDRLGADHIGVVVDEGIDTWDLVDEPTARAIVAAIERAKVVALSLSTDPARIARTVELMQPAMVHLARADQMSTSALDALRERLAPVELMLTVPVLDVTSVDVARRLASSADWLLLDTSHPDTGVVGATGHTHDWQVSAAIIEAVGVPVFLAGGLGPHNVTDAIAATRPAGVDSETRTSLDHDRRRKDLAKTEQFIALAHAR